MWKKIAKPILWIEHNIYKATGRSTYGMQNKSGESLQSSLGINALMESPASQQGLFDQGHLPWHRLISTEREAVLF